MHGKHVAGILADMVEQEGGIWYENVRPAELAFTVAAHDRWTGNDSGLAETNPVFVREAGEAVIKSVIVMLYFHKHDDGAWYHYDWISTPRA